MTAPGNQPIGQDRPPRTIITYDIPGPAIEERELPFVIGVMADLSGKSASELPALASRRFCRVDLDNFDAVLKSAKPRVVFQVPNLLTGEGSLDVNITFEGLEDFSPGAVVKKVEALQQVHSARERLAHELTEEEDSTPLVGYGSSRDHLARIEEIDRQLTAQVNCIIHHHDFQELEATWRGFHFLVSRAEPSLSLQIKVLNISKKKLSDDLRKFPGTAWQRSRVFELLERECLETPGGTPFGCLIGDYYFDHCARDYDFFRAIESISAASHAPFISGAASRLCGLKSWRELGQLRDLARIFDDRDHVAWRSLRESEDTRFIGLTMTRFLGRLPYGPKTVPVAEFPFEEDVEGGDHSKFLWCNAAYAMGANIARAFARFGWCARIHGLEGGGLVEALPRFSVEPGVEVGPVETVITESQASALEETGLMPLVSVGNTTDAFFPGARSIQKPRVYDRAEITETAAFSARLPYLFAICRFTHYLQCIVRDQGLIWRGPKGIEELLNLWLGQYVFPNGRSDLEYFFAKYPEKRPKMPLLYAEIRLREVEGDPGRVFCELRLVPHYQLANFSVSLRTCFPLKRKTD